jgi:uncharacterized protein
VLRGIVALAALLAFSLAAYAQVPVPPLTGRVVDTTGTLSAEQRAQLESRLAQFERDKGSQIAVLIVPTTGPEPIESFGIRVAEAWKIGRKGVDDGVIVVVAKDDRAMRLEVGYGLEGVIPDVVAKRLIEGYFVPHFRQDDWYGGLSAGVERTIKLIEGEPLPPARAERSNSGGSIQTLFIVFFALVFIVGGLLRALLGRFLGSSLVGTVAGVAGWVVLGSAVIAGLVGLAAFAVSLFAGLGAMGGGPWRGGRSYGGWGGGGFGGGGFGGGGFRGGGGGFGGGGASGRW